MGIPHKKEHRTRIRNKTPSRCTIPATKHPRKQRLPNKQKRKTRRKNKKNIRNNTKRNTISKRILQLSKRAVRE